jgi:hypothetical protein
MVGMFFFFSLVMGIEVIAFICTQEMMMTEWVALKRGCPSQKHPVHERTMHQPFCA